MRLALLCGKLEDAFATVFRQVAMTRFEQALHAARREEGELPLERVNELWMDANRPMFGDSVSLSDDYAWWWLYIPHFVHSPFYCYAYAFGELLVLALLRRYDEEGAAFVPRYLALLEAGGSDTPERLLGAIGLDIADPAFWNGGLDLLEELLEQAEALAAQQALTATAVRSRSIDGRRTKDENSRVSPRPPACDYVELRCRSAFSFLEASSNPEDLAFAAAEQGHAALALADRDGLYGIPRFHAAARAAGVRRSSAPSCSVAKRAKAATRGQRSRALRCCSSRRRAAIAISRV